MTLRLVAKLRLTTANGLNLYPFGKTERNVMADRFCPFCP